MIRFSNQALPETNNHTKKGNTMFDNQASAAATNQDVPGTDNTTNDSTVASKSLQQPEQLTDIALEVIDLGEKVETAATDDDKIISLGDMLARVKQLQAAIQQQQDELSAKAKEKQAANKLKELLESGVTDPAKLQEALDAMRPVSKSTRKPYDKNEPKVHENLAKPNHNDFKWGYTGSLRSQDSKNPGQEWAKKRADGSADPDAFRKPTEDEIKEMERRRDVYRAAKEAKRAEKKD